jgi:hypothetical protein
MAGIDTSLSWCSPSPCGGDPVSRQPPDVLKKPEDTHHQDLIRWSIQKVRRIANKLAQVIFSPPTSSLGRAGDERIRPPRGALMSN